jgi:hypothetical protein
MAAECQATIPSLSASLNNTPVNVCQEKRHAALECVARLLILAARTPTIGTFKIDKIFLNAVYIIGSWRRLVGCTECPMDVQCVRLLHTAAGKQIGLYGAAMKRYIDDVVDGG